MRPYGGGSHVELGIFTRTFDRGTIADVFAVVADHGLSAVQFNWADAGLAEMPDGVPAEAARRVRDAAAARGVAIAAVSGTFNMAHPDPDERARGLARLRAVAGSCAGLGTDLVTLCTGTRDRADMWRRHPGNDGDDAWTDLLATMRRAVAIADGTGVRLAFEPEPGNVANTPERAARLLDAAGSDRLGVVLDPANLTETGDAERVRALLDEAFARFGDRIWLGHAKDRRADGTVCPAGQGTVPWRHYLDGLRAIGYRGAVVLHGLDETDVPAAVAALRAAGAG